MRNGTAIVEIPMRVRIWKRGRQHLAVVRDEVVVEELMKYVGVRVRLVINHGGIELPIEAKPIIEREGNRTYILFTLPRRLNILWQGITEARAKVIIEKRGMGEA
ncbi:hypothetical protein [Vulcanisaeta sp. JCM 16159]|uniref:hypothetical protein n=1 Tax=Vulcanisaeta sp. JCM 16159 TaxID=1295371 RepID=UPI001FB3BCB7|nr:hypothetical protein [Vulcanisaeta sp. JCM 16159]